MIKLLTVTGTLLFCKYVWWKKIYTTKIIRVYKNERTPVATKNSAGFEKSKGKTYSMSLSSRQASWGTLIDRDLKEIKNIYTFRYKKLMPQDYALDTAKGTSWTVKKVNKVLVQQKLLSKTFKAIN